ncbi:glycosyltransferase family 4 protein [Janibacter indicus]|uniref:glycosyltransferase family 4 protein n=1 Tax=Janibacter indicus TaxID=857417 RepID=UPI003EB88E6A
MTGTQRRIRVALVASSFHPYTGGVEQHVRQVAGELQRSGADVIVWTVDRGEHLEERDVDGIPVRYLPTPLPARSAAALLSLLIVAPRTMRAWWRAYRDFRPEVLHVHCFGPNGIYALALNRLTGTPLVVTSHGETFADDHGAFDRSALLRAALRRAITTAVAVTAPSQFVLEDLRGRFGLTGGEVVPNGVHLDDRVGEPPVMAPGRVVFAVGRLERMKGFDLLLDAVATLDDPTVQVVIGGDGAEFASLRAQAERLGLSDRVQLPGRLSGEEIGAVMRAADVVVVPSRREAFGIVALEAWRAGTPVVGTCHGGMAEFITDGQDGLIIDPTRAPDLAAAIRRVLDDEKCRDSLAAAGSRAVQDFTWQAVTAGYMSVYHEIGPAT